jgi:DNA polymerase III subunit beta
MKIQVEQDELKRAVGWAARTLPARPSSPLHAGIRIEAGTDRIRLTTFDAETATRADVDAVIDEPGMAVVPGKLLADIAKELPRQPVILTLEGTRLGIQCGRISFGLPTYALDQQADLPTMPRHRGEVKAGAFADAVSQVHIAASRDDLLPPLTGIRLELSDTHLTMVATDRYRLAIRQIEWQPAGGSTDLGALVKARQLADLAHSLDPSETVHIALGEADEGRVGFSVGGRELITRVMHGDFPSYRGLLPESAETTAVVSAEELMAAVKRVKIVTSERNTPIKLSFSDDEVRLRASGVDDAMAFESLECSIEGDGLDIAFNPELLMEGLNAAHSAEVALAFNGPSKAAIIRPQDSTGYRYLLMPMRSG